MLTLYYIVYIVIKNCISLLLICLNLNKNHALLPYSVFFLCSILLISLKINHMAKLCILSGEVKIDINNNHKPKIWLEYFKKINNFFSRR